jgi:tetratricopeptide (TPR) repeat protein
MTETPTAAAPRAADPRDEALDLLRRGRDQRLGGDIPGFEEAVPLLREAIELSPACAPAYAELSTTYFQWGLRRENSCFGFRRDLHGLEYQSLYDLAFEYAQMALRLAPDLASAHRAMAAALRRGRRADPGRRTEEALLAAELDPDDPENVCERWRVRGFDPDDPEVRRALEREPRLFDARLDLAASLRERGRFDEALSELHEALRHNPRSVQAYYDVAMVLDRKGMREKALEVLHKAGVLRPGDPLIEQGRALLGEAP